MNNNKTATNAWIVLANDHQARLVTARRTPTGRCHLSEAEAIESPIPAHDRGRPAALNGMNGHSYADNLRTLEEERRRFAKQLSQWLHTLLDQHHIQHLTVFAPSRSIGYLRELIRKEDIAHVDLIDENLMRLPNDALRSHHAVMSVLGLSPTKEQSPDHLAGYGQGLTDRPIHRSTRTARRNLSIREISGRH